MNDLVLKGITWNHSRALPPLVAAAQRYEETHPGIRIDWQKRTLHEFGHASLATLAQTFDLLVIDHPMVGDAESSGALVDLHPLLAPAQLQDLHDDAMGPSFTSYLYAGKLYALPIDAAAPAACYRFDLLERHGVAAPALWSDVIALARSNLVRMPGFCADLFLNFMGLCVSLGAEVAASPECLVADEFGSQALEMIAELASHMPDTIYRFNPIAIYEGMAASDDYAYCPFAYTYSNYSRDGFASRLLHFTNPVRLDQQTPIRTILGGTGIAISPKCPNLGASLDFALYASGRSCQATTYGVCGGQPARRSAWQSHLLNGIAHGFFRNTADSLERAYVRPRYAGYTTLQEAAGEAIGRHCRERGQTKHTLETIQALYRSTRRNDHPHV